MAAPQGVCIAFDAPTLQADPTWTRLDTTFKVTGWTVDRGRTSEFDQTGTGTATITLFDTTGAFDPTNTSGTYYGKLLPMKQAAIALWNPVDAEWNTVFRGYVEKWNVKMDITERFSEVQIDLMDALGVLARSPLRVGEDGGYNGVPGATPPGGEGNVFYQEDLSPRDRIITVLADVDWPDELAEIFSGNVSVQEQTYADADALAAIRDAADAEFPFGVGVVYANRQGTVTFHGRMARFRPDVAEYNISQWKVGDVAAFAADSNTAVASELSFDVDTATVFNSAQLVPKGNWTAGTLESLLVENTSSIGTFGFQPLTGDGLLTGGGRSSNVGDPIAEVLLFNQYAIANMSSAHVRVSDLKLTTPPPSHPTATRVWRTISESDISDIFNINTTHFGTSAAGFGTVDFFIEGMHLQASPFGTSYLHVEASYDLSPRANYTVMTFGTTATIGTS